MTSKEWLATVDFAEKMHDYSADLDRGNRATESSSITETAREIASNRLGWPWFRGISRAMKDMTKEMQKNRMYGQGGEAVIGPIFRTGADNGVGALVLLPILNELSMGATTLSGVVHGTPALIHYRDTKLAENITKYGRGYAVAAFTEGMSAKAEKVIDGKAKMYEMHGGWGSHIGNFMHRSSLIQRGIRKDDGLQYELSVTLGLMGSSFTLNEESLLTNRRSLAQLRLPHFVNQFESGLKAIGKLMIPWGDPVLTMKNLSPDLVGHSMGAYTIIQAACREEPRWEVIRALKNGGRTHFVSDKAVIMGNHYHGPVEEWMKDMVKSPHYKRQVILQEGAKGQLIRTGANINIWGKPLLTQLRAAVGPKFEEVKTIFRDFLTPERMWDGENMLDAHLGNYFDDILYHFLCIQMLDEAAPVLGDATVGFIRENEKGKRLINNLYFTMGGNEQILRHFLGGLLTDRLIVPDSHCSFKPNCAHHPDVDEIVWMMGLDERKVGE